jgi:acetoin utilization protein AcuB
MNVENVMTRAPKTCSPADKMSQAVQLMWDHDFGCVPVVDGKELVGIVTTSDLLDLLAEKPRRRSGPERPLIRS